MSHKRKADFTPEEWQKQLEKRRDYAREYAKAHRKHKADYTEEEWNDILKRKRDNAKHKEDYTDEEWQKYLKRKRQANSKLKEYRKVWVNNNREKTRQYVKKWQENNKEKIKAYRELNKYKKYQKTKEWLKQKVSYDQYADKLTIDEAPIKDDNGFMLCKDYHTKEYFYPTRLQVKNRIASLYGQTGGECHLYKSNKSKKDCVVFNAKTHRKGTNVRTLSLARDPAWRDMVISRADGHCERCGKECDSLIAHHKVPVASCAMMAADIDNGMALCPECHREVHSTDGCRLHELAAEKREAV